MNKVLRHSVAAFALAVVFSAVGVTETKAQGILNEILKRMDNHNKNLTSLRAEVTMVKFNAQLKDSETTVGTAIYRPRPGKDALVRIDWRKPDESLAVVDKQYIIYRPRLNQAYQGSTNSAQGNAKAGGALAFMSMSKGQLRQNFEVAYLDEGTLSDGTKTVHLELTPKTRQSYKSAEIWVDANGMPVQSKVTEHNSDTTTVLLSKLEKNITITGDKFKIVLPKGTTIVKA
ncbi:MAG: outer membrane lipoprotein carrier protein LolA [Saprospiraceae bacterium]|nr:outer membrane lipoprotein carrier protein LolA [Pyrinomonadaceae bacterium]